jgi:hypothetical protein
VIGGFPFREQIAWLPSLLQDAIAARLSDRADQVIRTLHIFGKAVVPGSPGFAEKQIASDLLAKETSPEANLQDWFAWVEEVLRKIPESTALYSTDYDWDETGRLPAALAGRSHLLVVNSAAESRRAIFRKNFERANVREPILPLR